MLPAVEGSDIALVASRVANDIGFPALVKAVAGGGGKGMRVVSEAEELLTALAERGPGGVGRLW